MDPATDWVASDGKMALDFDGSNDYVQMPSMAWPQNAFSLSFHGRFRDTGDTEVPVTTYDISTGCYFQLYQNAGAFTFRIHQVIDTTFIGRTGGAPTTSWSNIVCVWTGGTTSSAIQIWQNGVRVDSSDSAAGSFTAPYASRLPMFIGMQLVITPEYKSDSQLDDIRIYNRAITPSEIALLATRRGIGLEPARNRRYAIAGSTPATPNRRNNMLVGCGF
jgi:hypothetical protein